MKVYRYDILMIAVNKKTLSQLKKLKKQFKLKNINQVINKLLDYWNTKQQNNIPKQPDYFKLQRGE